MNFKNRTTDPFLKVFTQLEIEFVILFELYFWKSNLENELKT
jgi:hypothetical protein